MDRAFEVEVLVGIEDAGLRRCAAGALASLPGSVDIAGTRHDAAFRTTTIEEKPADALLKEIEERCASADSLRLVVVSDRLVEVNGDEAKPTGLAESIRSRFWREDDLTVRDSRFLCSLVALAPAFDYRTRDVDRILNSGAPDEKAIRDAIVNAGRSLWLRAPPPRSRPPLGPVEVRLARDVDELRDCLGLRHEVYEALGYLDPETVARAEGLDLDTFDQKSIHFVAREVESGRLAGTMRLIIPAFPPTDPGVRTAVGHVEETSRFNHDTIHEIARENSYLKDALSLPAWDLPLTNIASGHTTFIQLTDPRQSPMELSRLVVHPDFRGLEVSTLLVRAGVATARSAGRGVVLLECIPSHARMYEKHGFELFEQVRGRAPGLGQFAVAMRFELTENRLDHFSVRAENDLRSIFARDPERGLAGKASLCLCSLTECWSEGLYESAFTDACPLPRGLR